MRSISKTDRVFLLLLLSAVLSTSSLYFFHDLDCHTQATVTQSGCCGTMEAIGCGADCCSDFCGCVSDTQRPDKAFLPMTSEISIKKNLKIFAALQLFFSDVIGYFSHSTFFYQSVFPPGKRLAFHIPSTILLI